MDRVTVLRVFSVVLLWSYAQCRGIAVETRKSDTNSLTPCWTSIRVPDPGHLTSCYDDGMCRCSNESKTADCSSNEGRLTFMPFLPGSFLTLNFSNNKLSKISDETFFLNASRAAIRVLDLYNNGLIYVARGVFKRFSQLRLLLLGGNLLRWHDMAEVLNTVPSMLDLDVKCNRLKSIPVQTFAGVNGSQLRALDLSINDIKPFDMGELQPLRGLKYLYVWKNEITDSDLTTGFLASLVAWKFKNNYLVRFPKTCKTGTKESLFPALRNLELEFNVIQYLDDPICLPSLTSLTLRYNKIMSFRTDMFSAATFHALNTLSLAFIAADVQRLSNYTFNNPEIRKLDFSSINPVNFSDDSTVDKDVFGGCTGLIDLILTGNDFQTVSEDRFQRLFQPVSSSLETLHLGRCRIGHLSAQFFANLTGLKFLYLYSNGLTQLPDGVFDGLRRLQELSLDSNQLTIISSNTFSTDTQHRVKTFDLSGNPYECTCHLLWFKKWLISDPGRFTGSRGYRCHLHGAQLDIRNFQTSEQACMLGHDAAAFTLAISCLLLSFFLVFGVVCRYRWRIRLWLYESCRDARRRARRRALNGQGRDYKYHLFVGYAAQDLPWIQRELLPVLEGQWKLRLCIHQRDFELGKHIVDNISESVRDSERVLLLFSPHFARSEWCQFELKYCQGSVMERGDVLVLVSLQDTESRDITGAMLAVLQTTTYIEWDDDSEARASFWSRLRLALSD